jgi:hypothetical protein
MSKSLNPYNKYIIDLYNQNRSITYIIETLYKRCNTKLKSYNKNSGGMWFETKERHTKAECSVHVYDTIYKYIRSNK